jgi:hypothetical protein
MPSITKSLLLLAALQVFTSIAAPIPQLAGEGAACNSVLSSTDNGVGYGIENAEGMCFGDQIWNTRLIHALQTTLHLPSAV